MAGLELPVLLGVPTPGSVSLRKRKVRFVVFVSISYFEGCKEMVAQCESRTNTWVGVKTHL